MDTFTGRACASLVARRIRNYQGTDQTTLHFPFMYYAANFTPSQRAICEYTRGVRPILEKALTKEEQRNHWYGVFMGTTVEHRCKGLGSSIFLHMQDRARADGLPLSFEAATAKNRDLYLRHGSQIVGEFTVGKGEVGPDGLVNKQGEGIIIWSMVWRP